MNTKTILTSIITFLIISACSTDHLNNIQDEEMIKTNSAFNLNYSAKTMSDFDYSFYDNYKNVVIADLKAIREMHLEQNIEGIQLAIDFINNEHGSSIEMIQYDYDLLNSNHQNWQDFHLSNNYLSKTEVNLFEQFSFDADTSGFETALENLKTNILKLKPSTVDFYRYNQMINTLMIANDYFDSLPANPLGKKPSWWKAAGCAVAIASNAYSTYGLIACAAVPPAGCGVAVTVKVLALAGVIFGCA